MTLDALIRNLHGFRRVTTLGVLGGALALATVSCDKDSTKPDPIHNYPVWDVLQTQSIPEDSPDGTLVYANLTERATFPGPLTFSPLANDSFTTYIDGKDLKIKDLVPDYAGTSTVKVIARGGTEERTGQFLLNVTNIDDPASWLVLQNRTITMNSPNGTLVYGNIDSLLTDPDSPKSISVTSDNAHLEVFYQKPDLRIRNMEQDWMGQDSVKVTGNSVPSGFILTVTDSPTTWDPVPNIHCDEDDVAGTIVLSHVANHVNKQGGTLTFTTSYDLNQVHLSLLTGQLVISQLDENWNGTKTFNLVCNDVSSNNITLTVNSVDDPARWTQTIDDVIFQDIPAEGTIIVDDLDTYAEDIDNNLFFRVTSQQPYTLAIEGNALKIRNIPQEYSGRETITMTCNNVPTTFDLGINEPFLTEIFRKEDFPSDVLTRIFMNDKLVLAYNHPYLTILSVPGFNVVRTDEIGYSGKKYLADTGRFIFMGDTYDGVLYKMDRQSFTPISSVEPGQNFNAVVTNGTYVYAILWNTVKVYNENLGLITTYTSPFDFAGNSAFAHEDELVIGRSDSDNTLFDVYGGLDFELAFTGSMTPPEEIYSQSRDELFGCGDHFMLVSNRSIKVYDADTYAVLQSQTFPWAIMNTAIGNDYVYYELYNNYREIRDIQTWQNRELDLHGVTNQDGVGFYNDLFLYGTDGSNHASVIIYQMNGK